MKRCFKCGVEKPLRDFYRHGAMGDGRLGKCKECTKADVKANYRAKRDRYAEYERERFRDPERKKKLAEYMAKMRKRNPEKFAARAAVSNAIRDGRMTKTPCEKCGAKAQAHHHDYSKPLDVRWLCFGCHREEHGQSPLIRTDEAWTTKRRSNPRRSVR